MTTLKIRVDTQTVPAQIKDARVHATTYVEILITHGQRRIYLDFALSYRLSAVKLIRK